MNRSRQPSENPREMGDMETAGIEPASCFGRDSGVSEKQIPIPLRNLDGDVIAYAVIDLADAPLAKLTWYLDSMSSLCSGRQFDRRVGGLHVRSWQWFSSQGRPHRETYLWAPGWTLHIAWTRRRGR